MDFVVKVDDDFTFDVYDEEEILETEDNFSNEDCSAGCDNLRIKEEIEDVDIEEGYLNVDGKFIDLLEIKREFDVSEDEEEREIEILPFDSETLTLDPSSSSQSEENEMIIDHFDSRAEEVSQESEMFVRIDKIMSGAELADFDTSLFDSDQNGMSNSAVNVTSDTDETLQLLCQSNKDVEVVDDLTSTLNDNNCQSDKNEGFIRIDRVMSNVKSTDFDTLQLDKETESRNSISVSNDVNCQIDSSANKENVPDACLNKLEMSKSLLVSEKKSNCQNRLTDLDTLCQRNDGDCLKESRSHSNLLKVPLSVSTVINESLNNKSSSLMSNVTQGKVSKVNICQRAASSKFKPTLTDSCKKFYPNSSFRPTLTESTRKFYPNLPSNRLNNVKKIEFRPPRQLNTFKFRNSTSQRFRKPQFPWSPTSDYNRYNRFNNNYYNNSFVSSQNTQTFNVTLSALSQLIQNQNLTSFLSHNQYYQQSKNFYNYQQGRQQTFNTKRQNFSRNNCGMNQIVGNNFFSESVLNVQQILTFLQSYSTILCAINQLNNNFNTRNGNFIGYTNNVTVCMAYLNMFGSR